MKNIYVLHDVKIKLIENKINNKLKLLSINSKSSNVKIKKYEISIDISIPRQYLPLEIQESLPEKTEFSYVEQSSIRADKLSLFFLKLSSKKISSVSLYFSVEKNTFKILGFGYVNCVCECLSPDTLLTANDQPYFDAVLFKSQCLPVVQKHKIIKF